MDLCHMQIERASERNEAVWGDVLSGRGEYIGVPRQKKRDAPAKARGGAWAHQRLYGRESDGDIAESPGRSPERRGVCQDEGPVHPVGDKSRLRNRSIVAVVIKKVAPNYSTGAPV